MTNLKYKFNEFILNMQSYLMGDHIGIETLTNLHTYRLEELGNRLPGWKVFTQKAPDGTMVQLENRTTKLTVLYNNSNHFIRIKDEYWKDLKIGFSRNRSINALKN